MPTSLVLANSATISPARMARNTPTAFQNTIPRIIRTPTLISQIATFDLLQAIASSMPSTLPPQQNISIPLTANTKRRSGRLALLFPLTTPQRMTPPSPSPDHTQPSTAPPTSTTAPLDLTSPTPPKGSNVVPAASASTPSALPGSAPIAPPPSSPVPSPYRPSTTKLHQRKTSPTPSPASPPPPSPYRGVTQTLTTPPPTQNTGSNTSSTPGDPTGKPASSMRGAWGG